MDSVADGVFTVNRQWRITSFNRAAEEITGWKREDALGRPCREVFRSSVCGDACILGQAVTHGRPVINRTIFMKRIDGRNVPVSISAAPLVDHAGRVIGGVETFRDVTASLERDLILDSVADGVFTVDEDWRITSFNRAAEKITGWKREEAVGRPCREIFHSSICGEACAIAQCMVTGAPTVERPITIQRKDGKALSVSISAAPLTDHEGNVIGGVETFRDLSLLTSLRKQLARRYTFGDIISKSPAMQRIFDILPEIARSDSNVLITGESGTGKELIAQAIHDLSERRKGPFVAVNCGALPDTLLESELFGYKAGAFTDAKHDRPGRLAAAEKGTLFLDEIGDISPAIQVKLLRVLQTRMYEPLGSNRPVKADVRILAATNRDLQALVAEERFREDLYYRLNVARVHLPPLRERIEDVPLLVNHFIEKFNAQKGKAVAGISDEALRALMHYDFPGNIRELENIIEYAFILCHGGFIELEHLPEPFSGTGGEVPAGLDLDQALSLEEIEKRAIYQALKRNRWKRLATCRELGISKDTLRRKIQKYRLEVPED
nr:sigma 54-interacting transcriptional regulator [Dissulfurirhabdus thermomarina]